MASQYDPRASRPDEITGPISDDSEVPIYNAESPAEDIVRELGDEEDVMNTQPKKAPGKLKRFLAAYWQKRKWTLPLTVFVLFGIVFSLPVSRYPLLALVQKRAVMVVVTDSKTNTPVTGATVTFDGRTVTTNNTGDAYITAKVGKRVLKVSKQYYTELTSNVFVGLNNGKHTVAVHLQATGRQVPVKVVNKVTGKPIANAEIKILDTEAKTDENGVATIVLPTGSPTQSATINANGYNSLASSVQLDGSSQSANSFALVPTGRVYFLSNLNGTIDVVSTNLDGSDRQTVLAGTGTEDSNNTILLASRDWQYLALLSKRDGGQYGKLFLINTTTNKLTTIDGGGAEVINPLGWSDHTFVYQLTDNSIQSWQNGQTLLKSYNSDTGKATTIDQTSASGSQTNYIYQTLSFVNLISDKVIYGLSWIGFGVALNALNPNQESNTIMSANVDGSDKTTLKSISIPENTLWTNLNSAVPSAGSLDIQSSINTNQQSIYYSYDYGNNTVTQTNTVTDSTFGQNQSNPVTYLVSPSGNQTFWAEPRDGKNTLFVGDSNGGNSSQVATLSDYTSYGWYSDNYLLVEKGGSELYIMSANGGQALKVSDYFKSTHNFNGYGGGYGGL